MTVGMNLPHDSAHGHVTGKSIFIDDRPKMEGEVFVLPVGVPASAGRLKHIDYQTALNQPGIIAAFTASDFYHNRWGTIIPEQPILIEDQIGYFEEPAIILVGSSMSSLSQAKKFISFEIEKAKPTLDLQDAINKKKFIYEAMPFKIGDVDLALKSSPHTLKGVLTIESQEHFYLESQASIAYPLEDGQIEIHASSQHPSETQAVVAESLGLHLSKVTCIVKRMGGGFGGKESQAAPFAAMAALVAQKLNVPARLCLSKDDDMVMTGKRHPFKNFYEVGFDNKGRILALKASLFADGGAYADLSSSILDRAMFHLDGAYDIPNAEIRGTVCRTNNHSNTAFRGFGGPQGTMTIESIIEEIAHFLKMDALNVREVNCYGDGKNNITPYGQKIHSSSLSRLFADLKTSSNYLARRMQIEQFNKKQNGKLRGLSMTATKFGISFTARHLNQGSAIVNLQKDGSIQVSTGATEMGQGVNTKIQQVVAFAFGVPSDFVKVMPTSTEKNHNTSPTAASSGADINCSAALKACHAIQLRLCWLFKKMCAHTQMNDILECPPLEDKDISLDEFVFQSGQVIEKSTQQQISLQELIKKAYLNRISMGEYAHFKTEGLAFDRSKGHGTPFKYFTNGVAVSEIEINTWTGQTKVIRSDILMDLGRPINPGIDRGQVTGAFIQALGWVTNEKLCYTQEGQLLSHSPTTYKIPNIQDIPRDFRIDFLENASNDGSVFGSKAVGEPPFVLGISVWTAIKDALKYRSGDKSPNIKSPATAEEILMELTKYE